MPEETAEQGQVDASAPSEEAGPTVLDLAETHTWDDGLSVSLGDFERFNEDDLGYSGGLDWVKFTVRFENGSDAPVEIDRIERSCNVGGVEGDYEAFDAFAHEWPAMIQPGATGIWEPACEMPVDENELQFSLGLFGPDDVDPSHEVVYFSGTVE
ncbi:hypothetical protein BJF83_20950 [Nocardiopsis sp. CNR-923]|nr:hypothetical protein BJF83_20950 [Nocardiopsis sp. CNR-923]